MNYTNTFRHFEYQGVSMSVTEAVMAMRLFIIQMAVRYCSHGIIPRGVLA